MTINSFIIRSDRFQLAGSRCRCKFCKPSVREIAQSAAKLTARPSGGKSAPA